MTKTFPYACYTTLVQRRYSSRRQISTPRLYEWHDSLACYTGIFCIFIEVKYFRLRVDLLSGFSKYTNCVTFRRLNFSVFCRDPYPYIDNIYENFSVVSLQELLMLFPCIDNSIHVI